VDVVSAVTDRDPADGVVVLADRRKPGPVHDVACDLRPLSLDPPTILFGIRGLACKDAL